MASDLSVSAKVTRPALGGGDLDINTGNYRIAGPTFFGGTATWDKKTVSSPVVEGDITTHRRRGNIMESLTVYVAGSSIGDTMANIRTLVDAFTQDRFSLSINIGTSNNQWDCEAADYSVQMDNAHIYNKYVVVTFSIPRKPIPLEGGY
jgi:hypothetical protein